MQARVKFAQLGQTREEALTAKQRRHAQMQAQDIARLHLRIHRIGQLVETRADGCVKGLAFVGEAHCLMLPREHTLADEFLQRAHPARQGRGAETKLGRRCLGGTQADDAHESFQCAQRRQAADGGNGQALRFSGRPWAGDGG